MTRKLVRFISPYGVVDFYRNRRRLAQIGRRLKPSEWLTSDWLVHEAEQTGLLLFPPGYVHDLRSIVDVGANTGQWSEMLLDCVCPAKLIMIEPGPGAFRVLQQKFGTDSRIQLHNVAIGEREGIERLHLTRDSTGASVLKPKEEMRQLVGGNWTVIEQVDVPMTTLDRLLADIDEISLLKIDVQGYEKSVLAGAVETLRRTKFLLVELNFMSQYEGGSWFGDLHTLLTSDYGFFLANASKPLCLNGRASMCDGLYVSPKMVGEWVKPDFV